MGAGGVWCCYYAFKLARAGHDVGSNRAPSLSSRSSVRHQSRTQTLRRTLRVFCKKKNNQKKKKKPATPGSAVAGGAARALLALSATDTKARFGHQTASCAGCVVLSLSNGVDNADRLRTSSSTGIIAAAVYVVSNGRAGHGPASCRGQWSRAVALQSLASLTPISNLKR